MSSRTSEPRQVALAWPGSDHVPIHSEARVDYLQERIGLLARLFLTMSCFFLVVGNTYRHVFFHDGPISTGRPDVALLTHLGAIALQAGVWQTARRRRWPASLLPLVDAALVLFTLAAQAFQIAHIRMSQAHHVDQVALLMTLCVLLCRAVTIPSGPSVTFGVACFGVLPGLAVALWDGLERGVVNEALTFALIWSAVTIALSTFISKVLHGLRESVGKLQKLGQYVIERKLGAGGMGEVYLARHTLLRRLTALKLLPPERAGESTVARFEREVRATSRLTHPNTVSIFDYGRTHDGIFYYAMEYLEGIDLQRLVERAGPLSPSLVVHVLAQIADALDEAHGVGLVHRDLKPANVFLCERGGHHDVVKVLDFGLVKETGLSGAEQTQTQLNALVGTPAYLAPESIDSPADVDGRTDLYAVGAIGYFLLTGKEVFPHTSLVALCLAHLYEIPALPSQTLGRALPEDLEATIMSCLAKAPADRPPSAAALRRQLLASQVPSWTDLRAS